MKVLLTILFLTVLTNGGVVVNDLTQYFKFKNTTFNFEIQTGYIDIKSKGNNNNSSLNFQLVYKTNTKSTLVDQTEPLIIWFNGGPGCSSQNQLFQDIGPIRVTSDDNISFNFTQAKYSWNNLAHLLFIDQPFGTGYSYTMDPKPVLTSDEASQYLVEFLIDFYNYYEQFRNNPVYIFGVSYAGHFVPSLARTILKSQEKLKLNFQGIGLGDPWISALDQGGHLDEFLFSAGVIDQYRKTDLEQREAKATSAILQNQGDMATVILGEVISLVENITGNIDMYNVQKYKNDNHTAAFVYFLNDLEYKKLNHIPDWVNFQLCNNSISNNFVHDYTLSMKKDVEYLLTQGKVLIYNGQIDVTIPIGSIQTFINNLEWSEIQNFKEQAKQIFKENGQTVGTMKGFGNLTFTTIYGAGHLAAYDQPESCYAMLSHFLLNDQIWK